VGFSASGVFSPNGKIREAACPSSLLKPEERSPREDNAPDAEVRRKVAGTRAAFEKMPVDFGISTNEKSARWPIMIDRDAGTMLFRIGLVLFCVLAMRRSKPSTKLGVSAGNLLLSENKNNRSN